MSAIFVFVVGLVRAIERPCSRGRSTPVAPGDARRLRRTPRRFAGTFAVVHLLGGSLASAAPPKTRAVAVELRYDAPVDVDGCLSIETFERALVERLPAGLALGLERGAPLRVSARIARDGDALRATVTLEEEGSEDAVLELVASSSECGTLGTAAALAASMAVERSTERRRRPHEPTVAADRPSEQTTEPPRSPAPAVPSEARAAERPVRPQIATHAAAMVGFGILPAPSAGSVVGAAIDSGAWRAGLEAGAFFPAEAASPLGGGARAHLRFVAATPCRLAGRFAACGVASVGDLSAAGTGPLLSRAPRTFYGSLGLRIEVELVRTPPFSFALHGGVLAPLVRAEIRIGDETLWRTPAIAGQLGLTWRITIL